MLNKTAYLTPAHAWARIAKAICIYGGEVDVEFYKRIKDNPICIKAVEGLQAKGVEFTKDVAFHWSFDLCGTFEVTHPKYNPPVGSDAEECLPMYDELFTMINGQTPAESDAAFKKSCLERVIDAQKRSAEAYKLAGEFRDLGLFEQAADQQVLALFHYECSVESGRTYAAFL